MYRVELKAFLANRLCLWQKVPNVPCGVESKGFQGETLEELKFLMYRVELKEL